MGVVAWSVYSVSMYIYVHLDLIESLSCLVQSGIFILLWMTSMLHHMLHIVMYI